MVNGEHVVTLTKESKITSVHDLKELPFLHMLIKSENG